MGRGGGSDQLSIAPMSLGVAKTVVKFSLLVCLQKLVTHWLREMDSDVNGQVLACFLALRQPRYFLSRRCGLGNAESTAQQWKVLLIARLKSRSVYAHFCARFVGRERRMICRVQQGFEVCNPRTFRVWGDRNQRVAARKNFNVNEMEIVHKEKLSGALASS